MAKIRHTSVESGDMVAKIRHRGISASCSHPQYASDITIPTQYGPVIVFWDWELDCYRPALPVVPEPNDLWRRFTASLLDILKVPK